MKITGIEAKQALRMRRFLMAVGTYVAGGALAQLCASLGYLPTLTPMWWLLGTTVGNLGFFGMIYSGRNLRLRDPSMTELQLIFAMFAAMALIAQADEVRGALLMFLPVPLLFGILRLDFYQMARVATIGCVAYVGVISMIWLNQPQRINLTLELFYLFALASVMLFVCLMCGYISKVRANLALAVKKIETQANRDSLTDLPNRRLLLDRLQQAMSSALRHRHQDALLFLDMDDFKRLNDTLGHDKGDHLLQQIAGRVLTCVREGDTVARLGGDEFVVLLEDLDKSPQGAAAQAEVVARKIHKALRQPYQLGSHGYHSSASIGITLFGGVQRESIEEPLKRAELAMYKAKAVGRDNLRFFEAEMGNSINARADLEAELHKALAQGQFLLDYQAQVDRDAYLTGVEALLRWQHPERGLISPAQFIPVAEANGLILPLGHWVLETACQQLAAWALRREMAHLTISVNVSARQFRSPNFVEQVLAILKDSGANPKHLKLELTESLLLDNMQDIITKMTVLKASGVGFSLDDFGTGYSSLSYLKRLPLDELKIDQGFVRDILTDPNDAAIAKMVVALADSMDLAVIAEGVETEAQRDALAVLGCHAYQGYLFSRPLPLDEFEAFVNRGLIATQ